MGAAEFAMERLRSKVCTWLPRIKSSTCADEVRVQTIPSGFCITVLWTEKGTGKRSHSLHFTQAGVFDKGRGFVPRKKPCDYARQIILEVLSKRGVVDGVGSSRGSKGPAG